MMRREGEMDPREMQQRELEQRRRMEQQRDAAPNENLRPPAAHADWQSIKSRFVDDPKGALAAADDLVRGAVEERIRRMQQDLDALRRGGEGEDAGTEGLRTRLLRYQAYFENVSGITAH